ncbi:MAG: tetratricopeptide repeat protein [Verrucomicrobia bacterium]|nr:tetratricopeptide repeat protein [Verrucomicrobiota bacterium]
MCVLLLLLVTCRSAGAIGIDFWHLRNSRTRAVLHVEKTPGATDACAEIYTRTDPAAGPVSPAIVDAAGTRVPFRVVANGPGDRLVVAFRTTGLLDYYLYYDPAEGTGLVPQRAADWQPESGVLLRTFAWGIEDADLNTVDGFRALVRASTAEYGGAYRPQIFQGPNPFGPSTRYVSVYTTFLRIEQAGRHEFATNSDDASLLYVNGTLVASYLGRHGPQAVHGEKNGAIELGAGVHRLDYFHAEDNGGQACVAAWKKPGDKHFSLIPAEAFVPIAPARVIRYQEQFKSLPDFRARVSRVYADEGGTFALIAVRFDAVPTGVSEPQAFRWSFGDGETATGKTVEHVYLTQGIAPVTLEIDDSRGPTRRVQHWVGVWHLEERNTQDPEKTRADFEPILQAYTLANHPTASLETIEAFYRLNPAMNARRMRVCQELVGRLKSADLARAHGYALELVDLYEALQGAKTVAVRKEMLESVLAQTTSDAHRVRAHLKLGELLLFYEGDAEHALEQLQSAAGLTHPGPLKRLALIRIGDAYVELGRTEDARQAYRAVPVTAADRRNAAILSEGYGLSVERLLAAGELDAALETLNTWEWRLPEVKLAGYSSLLRVRTALAQHNDDEARKYCRLIIDKLAEDAYKPEAYAALIRLLLDHGERATAATRFKELAERFPLSPEVRDLAPLLQNAQ